VLAAVGERPGASAAESRAHRASSEASSTPS
jgi:hypothetical protein